jgi:hypothetical protein
MDRKNGCRTAEATGAARRCYRSTASRSCRKSRDRPGYCLTHEYHSGSD